MSRVRRSKGKILMTVIVAGALAACGASPPDPAVTDLVVDSCAIALSEHPGETGADNAIWLAQERLRHSSAQEPYLERLGWAYMQKARVSFDPGWYQLAEHTGRCMADRHPDSEAALLLRGSALRSMHRFKEALPIARAVADTRGLSLDHALLGDVLVDLGRLDDAAVAYQRMMDLKPGPYAYVRAAELRWLLGDSVGARELLWLTYEGTGSGDAEAAAWVRVRLARAELEMEGQQRAERLLKEALTLSPGYAPALLWSGRIALTADRPEDALRALEPAAASNPLPEYLWALRDAYIDAGTTDAAARTEEDLLRTGRREDPRALALFLATTGQQPERAHKLALQELESRQDSMTLDTVAWTSFAAGDLDAAATYSARSLETGVQDPRLYLHAAIIADARGDEHAPELVARLLPMSGMLLPSEQKWLERLASRRRPSEASVADRPGPAPKKVNQ